MMSKKPPVVSSLSMMFKKSVSSVTEDVAEAKLEHRQNLRSLVDKFMEEVQEGRVEGIRNAKDLVEVIKLDLLIMGEATERTEQNNSLDEVKVQRVQQVLDVDDESVQDIMKQVMMALNDANDDADTTPVRKPKGDASQNE